MIFIDTLAIEMPRKIDFLIRTLQLAAFGMGKVSPAPLIGWVLVSPEHIILAEGWLPHKPISFTYLSRNKNLVKPAHSRQNVLYINTLTSVMPALTPLLASLSISKIYVASSIDVSELQLLPEIISWEDNLLHEQESFLNCRFYTFNKQQRPYVILKWAETSDGFIARENYDSKWISCALSRKLVHKWRTEEDAIMVGTNTAYYDNPKLNVRNWSGRNPVRIVIDKQLRLKPELNLFDNTQSTLCYNLHMDKIQGHITWVCIPEPTDHLTFFLRMLHDLWQRKIQSVIIEGGAQLLHFLIKHQLWDEARVFISPQKFGKGILAPTLAPDLLFDTHAVSDDILKTYLNPKS